MALNGSAAFVEPRLHGCAPRGARPPAVTLRNGTGKSPEPPQLVTLPRGEAPLQVASPCFDAV